MAVEGTFIGIGQLLLFAGVFGSAFTGLSVPAVHRLNGRALLALWLFSTFCLAAATGYWASSAFSASSERLWGFYLMPALFFSVQFGLVLLALWKAHRRGMPPVSQFIVGFLVFFVAVIPAALLALTPDLVFFFARQA